MSGEAVGRSSAESAWKSIGYTEADQRADRAFLVGVNYGRRQALVEAADALDAESERVGGMYSGDCTERLREWAEGLPVPRTSPGAPQ